MMTALVIHNRLCSDRFRIAEEPVSVKKYYNGNTKNSHLKGKKRNWTQLYI